MRFSRSLAAARCLALGLAAALLLVGGLGERAEAQKPKSVPVIPVETADPEMTAAIAKARASLPEFWAAMDGRTPGTNGFALKVKITDKSDVEHFWLNGIERKAGKFIGTINNEPATVKSVKFGQRYTFGEADITDWMFMRADKIVGNETMRPLLKRMPPDQAARFRAMLEKP